MLMDGNAGGLTATDVGAVVGNRGGFGGFGGDGAWWLIILFLFVLSGNNGWGGFGNGGMLPWMMGTNTNNDVQRGFDQQALMTGITGLGNTVTAGFATAESGRCNSTAQILQALNTNQNATTAGMNTLAMGLQNCCCENRAAVADLKYTVATENCADRAAVESGVRDIIESNSRNTQAILDKLCQQEIDALKAQNEALRTQLNMANLAASQTAQTAVIQAGQRELANEVEQYVNPTPRPAYVVQNPNCCYNQYSGCGCGYAA